MKKFRILTFDGGGVRGVLSIEILSRIIEKYPNFLDKVDLFSGTSTGSIIACLLAKGVPISEIRSLYSKDTLKKIFSPCSIGLLRPKYNNKALKKLLDNYFDDNYKISNFKKFIFIPSFYLGDTTSTSWKAVFFNNLSQNKTSDIPVKDAILASSAAPTYFPSYKNYIDGGVIANSPTAISLLTTLSSVNNCNRENVSLLSIGTGNIPEKITGKTTKWGALQWAFNITSKMNSPIISLLLDGMSDLENLYCAEFLKNNYFKINPDVPKFIDIDNYKYTDLLKSIGRKCDMMNLFKFLKYSYLS
ncbi:MAG: patatin-like phospholipase family protein [Clostridium sp.]|nr:patatin-like phospholipase family protein [Clostridium sp.]